MLNAPHFCPDNQGLLVVPGSAEMECCQCDEDGAILKAGDKVKTGFYPRELDKVRIVEVCKRVDFHCQTGWFITTTDGVRGDSAWFREA